MSIADRDYMRSDFNVREEKRVQPSLYKRFLFFLWRLLHNAFKKR
jgi:hypothetical protein